MFDFGFSELMVIMVVALIVIGPERLPKVARTLGHLWGRAQRYVNGVKADIERDMAVEEMEQSVKQATLTADQQVQQINEAVAKLSSPEQTTPHPTQPVESPPETKPGNKPE
jgi:sec-independent protein translocase protein TatB